MSSATGNLVARESIRRALLSDAIREDAADGSKQRCWDDTFAGNGNLRDFPGKLAAAIELQPRFSKEFRRHVWIVGMLDPPESQTVLMLLKQL